MRCEVEKLAKTTCVNYKHVRTVAEMIQKVEFVDSEEIQKLTFGKHFLRRFLMENHIFFDGKKGLVVDRPEIVEESLEDQLIIEEAEF